VAAIARNTMGNYGHEIFYEIIFKKKKRNKKIS
jgi:hypothetical protein